MDNTGINKENTVTKGKKKPTTAAKVLILFFSLVASAIMFYSLAGRLVFEFVFAFVLTVGTQTYLLRFIRSPLVLLVPCAASFICCSHVLSRLIALAAVLFLSLAFSFMLAKKAESFNFFIFCSLLYSVLLGAGLVLLMTRVFGSFGDGVEWMAQYIKAFMQSVADNSENELADMLVSASGEFVYLLPSVICELGVIAAWLTKWILEWLSRVSGVKSKLFSRVTGASAALGIVFVITSVVELILAFTDSSAYYGVMNVKSVLAFIFMGEGIREYIKALKRPSDPRKFIKIAILVALIMFSPALIVTVASYYGVYRAIFSRVRIIKITKE